jgi:TolB-like protein
MLFLFGDCTLDPARRELRRGGVPVHVEPQVLDLLLHLIENRDRVVSKDDLLSAVWQGRFVSESALNNRINAARQAVGDSGERQQLIRTMARRGFRFVGEVKQEMSNTERLVAAAGSPTIEDVASKQTTTSNQAATSRTDSVTATHSRSGDRPTVAVLPFANMSGDAEQEYFSDGITEDITTELSRFRNLFVIAHHTSHTFKARLATMQDIARELGVGYVVEGSVRKAANRVRITAQLIDTATGTHVWADHYDRSVDDVFAIQDEVATSIVARVVGRVEAAGSERARRKTPDSLSAYDYLLRGLACFNRFIGHDDITEACKMFTRAIELDPEYARAHACLAFALVDTYFWNSSQAALEQAWQAAKAAVALDDTDGRSHGALGYVLWARQSFDQSEYHFDTALRLNPHDADLIVLRGYLLLYTGRRAETLEAVDTGRRLNPTPPQWYWTLRGLALYLLHRYAEAAVALEQMIGRLVWDHAYLAACYAQLGRSSEARAAAAKVLEIDPDFTISKWSATDPLKSEADMDHVVDGLRRAGLPD